MAKERYPLIVAGQSRFTERLTDVTDKFTGETVSRVSTAGPEVLEEAITEAAKSAKELRRFPPYERRAVLEHCVSRFQERKEELAMSLCIEAGKPIKDARGEVGRLVETFQIAADESVRLGGEVMNLELSARTKGYRAMTQAVPVGPCALISPFNFPLNLVAHKVAPAIATGCPFVLKPATRTPIGALIIGEVLMETNLPKASYSILPCPRDGADLLVTDERLKLLSFTGSPKVGWDLKARAGKKKVVLELGGNAACVVDEDQGENLDAIVERLVFGGFYQSGQSCISVQRIFAHEKVYDALKGKLVAKVEKLVLGDPKDEATFLGPLISESEAQRLEKWIRVAESNGANVLCGGSRKGPMLAGTVLENVDPRESISAQEAFGPVVILAKYTEWDTVLDAVNDSHYGLQAGLFVSDYKKILRAWDELEVGGVVVGDVPSFRADNMPYGGVKDSGLGREGVKSGMAEMTETRLLVLRA
ncbi:MAG: aldehyde dehydrogenase family protein [Polyangiaceae bacterium]